MLRGEQWEARLAKLRELMERGLLEPCHTEWASPCYVVPKKVSAECRLAVDLHGLIEHKQHESDTLPLTTDML